MPNNSYFNQRIFQELEISKEQNKIQLQNAEEYNLKLL